MTPNLATIKPFVTSAAVLTAPCAVAHMANVVGVKILSSGNRSTRRKDALLSIAINLVGKRRPNEKADAWVARAQSAINARFNG